MMLIHLPRTKISEAIKAKGGYFLEASVWDSKKPAEDDQLFPEQNTLMPIQDI
ncbi:putative oxidoreductase GLYR1 [Spatholobus suberectus]|nr:putative oxidoreductase GLYR1 [Spatholobus suberectus]